MWSGSGERGGWEGGRERRGTVAKQTKNFKNKTNKQTHVPDHFCHAHLFTGVDNAEASCQLTPASDDSSTRSTSPAPDHARPSTATVRLGVEVHLEGEVIIDRTPSLVMISVSIGGLYPLGGVVVFAAPGLPG